MGKVSGRAGSTCLFNSAGELSWDPRSDQVQLGRDLVLVLYPPCYAGSMELVRATVKSKR